ncbi:Protein FYV10 [Rhodotorula toruloides]|nr:Protein FYV10 [Rhodotorula toruloides]
MSSSNKLVPEQVLLLEQATLKAPLDNLRRLQKQTQKTYEHNLNPSSTFQKDLDALLRSAASSSASLDPSTRAEMLKSVDSMLARMRILKRKLGDLKGQNDKAVRVVQTRLDHLSALPDSMDSPAYSPWARKRLAHQLVDYFLRSTPPLKESARELAREEGIEELVDTEVWDELGRVEKGLEEKRLDEVLAWVGENRTALKKLKSPLEFTIHLQAYIELCRARDAVSAIAYARKHLSPATAAELETSGPSGDEGADGSGKGSLMSELSRAMALLAYPPDTTCRVYQDLYSPLRWAHLRSLFRTTFLTLHSLPSIPLLHMSLQAGIASLKTPICCPVPSGTKTAPPSAWPLGGVKGLRTSITPDGEIVFSTSGGSGADSPSLTGTNGATQPPVHTLEGSPSPNCPLCSSPLSALGPDVPYSHHVNSTIVCGITGKVVEGDGGEGGQLVALVSRVTGEGRVYSKEGLALRASQHPEGKLIDPATGEVFEWDELKKVTQVHAEPSNPLRDRLSSPPRTYTHPPIPKGLTYLRDYESAAFGARSSPSCNPPHPAFHSPPKAHSPLSFSLPGNSPCTTHSLLSHGFLD